MPNISLQSLDAGRQPHDQACATRPEANRLLPTDRAVHDWYRFVLSFPPHLVRDTVATLGLGERSTVLDPFCGTGTTLVECKKMGIPSVGLEANPMAGLASRVKTTWDVCPEALAEDSQQIAAAARAELARCGMEDEPPIFEQAETPLETALLRLPDESAKLLLKDSISPCHFTRPWFCSLRCVTSAPRGRPTISGSPSRGP